MPDQWATPRAEHDSGRHRGIADTLHSQVKQDWPTPRASESENRQTKASPSQLAGEHGWSLGAAVNHQWATPTVNGAQNSTAPPSQSERNSAALAVQSGATVAAALSPAWVCRLMGFPDGWTVIDGPPVAVKRSTPASPRARRRASP
jgi:site-specific DNA-cytosine methylase